jgi:hypothetical protein
MKLKCIERERKAKISSGKAGSNEGQEGRPGTSFQVIRANVGNRK